MGGIVRFCGACARVCEAANDTTRRIENIINDSGLRPRGAAALLCGIAVGRKEERGGRAVDLPLSFAATHALMSPQGRRQDTGARAEQSRTRKGAQKPTKSTPIPLPHRLSANERTSQEAVGHLVTVLEHTHLASSRNQKGMLTANECTTSQIVRAGFPFLTVPSPDSALGELPLCPCASPAPAAPSPLPSFPVLSGTSCRSLTGEDSEDRSLEKLPLWLPCTLPPRDFRLTIETSPMLPCLINQSSKQVGVSGGGRGE